MTVAGAAFLAPFIIRRSELRLWFAGEIAIAISFLFGVLYRWGNNEYWLYFDSGLKLVGLFCAIIAILIDYRRIYTHSSQKLNYTPIFALAIFDLSLILIYFLIGLLSAIAFFLAIRIYEKKRMPTYAFMAGIMGVAIFGDIFFILRFFVPDAENLQIWVTCGLVTMATAIFAFSIVARAINMYFAPNF